MAVGNRIKRIRKMRGMTQKELGLAVGFNEKSADVRITQYELGTRTPKEKVIARIADFLDVNPQAISNIDIDSFEGLAHALFTLEDMYGLSISSIDGELCLTFDKGKNPALADIFDKWQREAEKLNNGEITEADYNEWRYNFEI
jgi:transcriptional regulator with XRE-family HTH domain